MTKTLDVLVIESQPWAGEAAARTLAEAGHRIHRCHDEGDTGYACVGLGRGAECPLDSHIDAAVLVRADGSAAPTPHEDGVRCALRSGVPVVEVDAANGADSPYSDWVALQSEEHAVSAACVTAVELAKEPLVAAVMGRIGPLLVEHHLDPDASSCSIETRWPELRVRVAVPGAIDRGLEQALSVRALDALRPFTTTFTSVVVSAVGDQVA